MRKKVYYFMENNYESCVRRLTSFQKRGFQLSQSLILLFSVVIMAGMANCMIIHAETDSAKTTEQIELTNPSIPSENATDTTTETEDNKLTTQDATDTTSEIQHDKVTTVEAEDKDNNKKSEVFNTPSEIERAKFPSEFEPMKYPDKTQDTDIKKVRTESSEIQITERLRECKEHLKANRLTTGKEGTALDCYREVLKISPDNTEALAGLHEIESRYIRWAKYALNKKDMKKVRQYLTKLSRVNPISPDLVKLKQRVLVLEKEAAISSKFSKPSTEQQISDLGKEQEQKKAVEPHVTEKKDPKSESSVTEQQLLELGKEQEQKEAVEPPATEKRVPKPESVTKQQLLELGKEQEQKEAVEPPATEEKISEPTERKASKEAIQSPAMKKKAGSNTDDFSEMSLGVEFIDNNLKDTPDEQDKADGN